MNREEDPGPGSGHGPGAAGKALGLLERAWEWTWALRIASIVLFIDLALLARNGTGVLAWAGSGTDWLHDLGFLAVAAAIFGLLCAILLPMAAVVLQQLVTPLAYRLDALFDTSAWHRPRPLGHAPAHLVREKAVRERCGFLMQLYRDSEARAKAAARTRAQLGTLVFGTLFFAVADLLAPALGAPSPSLLAMALERGGNWGGLLATVTAAGAVWMLKQAWFADHEPAWIYCPDLDDLLRGQERRAAER